MCMNKKELECNDQGGLAINEAPLESHNLLEGDDIVVDRLRLGPDEELLVTKRDEREIAQQVFNQALGPVELALALRYRTW